jgi:hypothetical protein
MIKISILSLGHLRREFQGVNEARFGELDLEAVFALRFCTTERSVRLTMRGKRSGAETNFPLDAG